MTSRSILVGVSHKVHTPYQLNGVSLNRKKHLKRGSELVALWSVLTRQS